MLLCIIAISQLTYRASTTCELLLMGHTWGSVRHVLAVSEPKFDQLLDDAIEQARTQQTQARQDQLTSYVPKSYSGPPR